MAMPRSASRRSKRVVGMAPECRRAGVFPLATPRVQRLQSHAVVLEQAMSSFTRSVSRLGAALVLGLVALAAHADWPDKPVTMILSFPPAGATDILARAIGQKMSESMGQSVVVENRPGAGGNIGLLAAARAPADGYNVYMAAVTNAAIAAAAYPPQPVHLAKDFVPIAGVAIVPHMLVVPSSLPAQNVQQLVALLKSAPGKHNFASQGPGTLSHLESELFKSA